MIMLLCWMSNTVFLTLYLFYRSIVDAMELQLGDSIFSYSFLCAVITSFFYNKEIVIRVILILDFLRFVATQVYHLTRFLLLQELYDDEFECLRSEFTVFWITKVFFLLLCQPTLCIYETSVWVVWFGYVLLVKMMYLLCKMKTKRLHAREEGAETRAMRGKLLLVVIAMLTVSLFLTIVVANVFWEAPFQYKMICAIDVVCWFVQFICKISHLLAVQYNVSSIREMIDDFETVIAQCFLLISFIHFWYLHRIFSPFALAVVYEVSSIVEKIAQFWELLRALETIDRFPSTRKLDLCTICQCPLQNGKLLPCGHAFHEDCLRAWLRVKNECPNCRQRIYLPVFEHTAIEQSQEINDGAAERQHQAAPRPNMTVRTDRYEFSIFIDLFSLLRPFYIGFTYERQTPWVPDVSEPESTSFNPEELPENSRRIDYEELPEESTEDSGSSDHEELFSTEDEPVEFEIDIGERPSNAEIIERKVEENDPEAGGLVELDQMWSYLPHCLCRCFSEEVEEDFVFPAGEVDPVAEVRAVFEG